MFPPTAVNVSAVAASAFVKFIDDPEATVDERLTAPRPALSAVVVMPPDPVTLIICPVANVPSATEVVVAFFKLMLLPEVEVAPPESAPTALEAVVSAAVAALLFVNTTVRLGVVMTPAID
jgi:hypothetical protein